MLDEARKWIERFGQREMRDDWMLRQLSSTCFVLAGFSFTSLALAISFRWQLGIVGSSVFSILLSCSIMFLIGGEFAREGYKVWQYVFAELLYLTSTGLVLVMLLLLGWELLGIHPMAVFFILAGIVFFFWKAIQSMRVVYRTNPPPTSARAASCCPSD
jgi:hypothetical protein